MAETSVIINIITRDGDLKESTKSLKGLTQAAKETGGATKEIGELEDALGGVADSSDTALAGLLRLGKSAGPVGLAIAGVAVGLTAVGVAAVKAGKEIFALSEEYADLANEIGKLKEETGVSAETLSALQTQANLTGREFSQVTSSIEGFRKKVVEAAGGSRQARNDLRSLGIDGTRAAADLDTAFRATVSTIAEMPKGVARADAANKAFGVSGYKILPFLDEFDGDINKIIESADEYGTLIGEENVRHSREFQQALAETTSRVSGLKNEFVEEFLPAVTNVLRTINDVLDENADTFRFWADSVGRSIASVVNWAGDSLFSLNRLYQNGFFGGVTNTVFGITNPSLYSPGHLTGSLLTASSGFAMSEVQLQQRRRDRALRRNSILEGLDTGLEFPSSSSSRGGSAGNAPFRPSRRAQALAQAANALGVDVLDLAMIISFETGGSFSPAQRGGAGNRFLGLIQFGPEEQRRYGVSPSQSFESQLMSSVVPFLRDRFAAVGKSTFGASSLDLYRTIIGGNPLASLTARDAFGTSALSGVQTMLRSQRQQVIDRFFGGSATNAEALQGRGTSELERFLQARANLSRIFRDRHSVENLPTLIESQTGVSAGGVSPRPTLNEVEIADLARLAPNLTQQIFAESLQKALGAGLHGSKAETAANEEAIKKLKSLEEEYVALRTRSVELETRRLHIQFSIGNHQKIINSMIREAKISQEEELDTLSKQLEVQRELAGDALYRQYAAEVEILAEKLELEREIFQLETLIAAQGANAAERYKKAWLEAIFEIRDANTRAIESQIRSQVRLGDMQTVHNEQIRARVLEHLAAQRSMTETIGGEIISLYEEIATRSEEILDRSIGKIPILGGVVKTLARQSLTRATTGFLDTFFPGAAGKIEALQNPELGELKTQTSILKAIEINTSIGAAATGGNVTINSTLGGLLGAVSTGSIRGGGPLPIQSVGGGFPGLGGGSAAALVREIINRATGDPGFIASQTTIDPGATATGRNGAVISGGRAEFPRLAGNVGAALGIAGSLIPGRIGGIVSAVGSGIGIASSLGTILSISALGGPIGLAIGAGIGLLTAVFGGLFGSKKRKRDKREKIPQLTQGFADAIQEFRDLIAEVRTFSVDPDTALSRGKELRQQIASGFGIQFESKKYRRIARERINQQLAQIDAKPDGLMQQLLDAVAIAKAAGDRRQRILPEFAGGVFMDALFRAQFGAFKRRNGLLPGSWSGSDHVPALLADAEMVLNPAQQQNVIANAGGRDVFAGAGIPNYQNKASSPPAVARMASGGVVLSGGAVPPVVLQPNFSFELTGVTFEEGARIWLQSDDGRRTLVKVLKEEG